MIWNKSGHRTDMRPPDQNETDWLFIGTKMNYVRITEMENQFYLIPLCTRIELEQTKMDQMKRDEIIGMTYSYLKK